MSRKEGWPLRDIHAVKLSGHEQQLQFNPSITDETGVSICLDRSRLAQFSGPDDGVGVTTKTLQNVPKGELACEGYFSLTLETQLKRVCRRVELPVQLSFGSVQ